MESQSKGSKVFEMFQEHASDLLNDVFAYNSNVYELISRADDVSGFIYSVEADYPDFYNQMQFNSDLMNAVNTAVAEELGGNDKINETESFNMIDDISSSASSNSIIVEDDNIIPINEDKGVFSEADMKKAIEESRKTYEVEKQVKSEISFGFRDKDGFDKEEFKKAIKESKKNHEKENDELRGFGGADVGRKLEKFDDDNVISKEAQQRNFLDHMNSGGAIPLKGLNAKPKYSVKKPSRFKRFCNWLKSLFTKPVEEVKNLEGFGLLPNHSDDSVSTTSSEDKNQDSFVKSINNIKEDRECDLNSSNIFNTFYQKSIDEIKYQ